MKRLWFLSRILFNQWAASSSSNYCSERPSPSLSNLSITHFHFFPRSHKSLVLSLLHSSSKRPKGSLDTCVNNRWQVYPPTPPLSKGYWRREGVYIFLLLHLTALMCVSILLVSLCIFSPFPSVSRPCLCVDVGFFPSLSLPLFPCQGPGLYLEERK